MKNEIMSKSDVRGWIAFFIGAFGYTFFIFYALHREKYGEYLIQDLSKFNKFILFLSIFLTIILGKLGDKYLFNENRREIELFFIKTLTVIVFFIIGFIFPSMFFVVIL